MINCFYRISDKSYDKVKLPGADKEVCLDNFIEVFGNQAVTIIADNCSPETLTMLHTKVQSLTPVEGHDRVMVSSLGNAGSARRAIQYAQSLPDDAVVYLVEDDYLHKTTAPCVELINEGIKCAAYVTLYDHPDKYLDEYNFGEISKVFRTKHSHWRQTISTTMTFATRVKTLKEDLDIWHKYTDGPHPWDHNIFSEITQGKKKVLAVSIPGASCHVDLTYSAVKKQMVIEEWAIDMMEHRFAQIIMANNNEQEIKNYHQIAHLEPSMQKLMMLVGMASGRNSC